MIGFFLFLSLVAASLLILIPTGISMLLFLGGYNDAAFYATVVSLIWDGVVLVSLAAFVRRAIGHGSYDKGRRTSEAPPSP